MKTAIGFEPARTASQTQYRNSINRILWIMLMVAVTAGFAFLMISEGPSFSDLAWVLFWVCVTAVVVQPRYGVYIIIFMTLVGDKNVSWWFPFTKNFSSEESLLFLSNSFSFSPLEIFIILTTAVWVTKGLLQRNLKIKTGPLFWPAFVFTFIMGLGLIGGLLTGGNTNIALWESRAIFYIFPMLVLTSNLVDEKDHVNILFWLIMSALFLEGIIGSIDVIFFLGFDISSIEALFDHSASIHANVFFLALGSVYIFKKISGTKKFFLVLFLAPIALPYFASQRRSAFLSLGVAVLLMFIIIYLDRRHLFKYIFPPLVIIGLAYMGAFWNNQGSLGLPVQAVKSVIAPGSATEKDLSSNLYRITENLNASFTIHQRPITGVGFGNKFFILYPLPDISFFEWWEYISHNSILWIWIKTGVFGFTSMIFMVALSILIGMRAIINAPEGEHRMFALLLVLFMVMHYIFAYVDISWTDQSMVLLGLSMGLLNMFNKIMEKPDVVPVARWPWQSESPP